MSHGFLTHSHSCTNAGCSEFMVRLNLGATVVFSDSVHLRVTTALIRLSPTLKSTDGPKVKQTVKTSQNLIPLHMLVFNGVKRISWILPPIHPVSSVYMHKGRQEPYIKRHGRSWVNT